MPQTAFENIRIEPEIGDGVLFTSQVEGVARRFFVSRQTLGELERTLLANHHDMLASFDRQRHKIRAAIANTVKFGTSANITFLKRAFFD